MTRIIRIFLLLASACCTIPAMANSKTESLNIVCTIKPACLLLDAIVGKQAIRTQLLPDNADLHHYSFRPSDLRKLSQANVVIRLSPTLERFINPLLNHQKQTIITLKDSAGLIRFPLPKQHQHHHGKHSEHQGHDHTQQEGQVLAPYLWLDSQNAIKMMHPLAKEFQEHQKHNHAPAQQAEETLDPHFWLNPQNAIKMAQHLANELTKINPQKANYYQQNSQRLIKVIQQSDRRIRQLLSVDQRKPYLTFHSGLQYFEKYYGLDSPEIVSLHENLPVGIKTMRHLRSFIKTSNIPCLIADPRSSKALIRTLTKNIAINIATLDPVGSTLPKTQRNYPSLLEHTAKTLHQCLKNNHSNN